MLPCKCPCIYCICLNHTQKISKLSVWPPFCPPNIWENNWIMPMNIWIIYPILGSVVAWNSFRIFELYYWSWIICICYFMESFMFISSGKNPMTRHSSTTCSSVSQWPIIFSWKCLSIYFPGAKTGHHLPLGFTDSCRNSPFSHIARIPVETEINCPLSPLFMCSTNSWTVAVLN